MYSQCAGLWSSLKIRMPCLGQGILILDPDCKNNLEFGAHCMNLYIFNMTQKNNTGSQNAQTTFPSNRMLVPELKEDTGKSHFKKYTAKR